MGEVRAQSSAPCSKGQLDKGVWENGKKQSQRGQKGEIRSALCDANKTPLLLFQDELMYMLRKLLLNIGDFPAQTSHILFNYLVSSLWVCSAAQNLTLPACVLRS